MKARADSPLSLAKDFDTTRHSLIKQNQYYTIVRMRLYMPVNTRVGAHSYTMIIMSHALHLRVGRFYTFYKRFLFTLTYNIQLLEYKKFLWSFH